MAGSVSDIGACKATMVENRQRISNDSVGLNEVGSFGMSIARHVNRSAQRTPRRIGREFHDNAQQAGPGPTPDGQSTPRAWPDGPGGACMHMHTLPDTSETSSDITQTLAVAKLSVSLSHA